MAASLEVRVPFLDHRLVELAATMEDNLKIRNGEGKYILKRVAESLLPGDIVRRRKMGFPVPLSMWFREREDCTNILSEKRTADRGLFDPKFVQNIVQEHRQGQHDLAMFIWLRSTSNIGSGYLLRGRPWTFSPLSITALPKKKIPAFEWEPGHRM